MLSTYIENLNTKILNAAGKKYLCAVSGGVDSMVMTHLMQEAGYTFGVAHVDHLTRDGQSTADATFVKTYCQERNIPYYQTELSQKVQGNFQSVARSFRYKYFDRLRIEHDYDYILTAHHKTDRWETFLFNLSRSAGVKGLSTLRYVEDCLLRPLLPFTREEVEVFAERHNIAYVHDASNDGDAYVRNQIRHHITPAVQSVLPDMIASCNRSMDHLEQADGLLEELIEGNNFIHVSNDLVKIDLDKVKGYTYVELLLYRLTVNYGFTRSDVQDMLQGATGAQWQSSVYEALLNRDELLIRKKGKKREVRISIGLDGSDNEPFKLVSKEGGTKHLGLDSSQLTFPITIRNWMPGDTFKPLGMGGKHKKLKDFLTDLKLSRWEKENVLVALSGEEIIQVIGYRTADGKHGSDIWIEKR